MVKGSRRFVVMGLLALAGTMVASGTVASAGTGGASRQSSEFTFTSQRPGTATGVSNRIDYFNPADRSAKPFAVDEVILRGHPGTQLDTSVPARCGASDAQLVSQGAAACPRGSIVGGGVVRTDSGTPGILRRLVNDVTLVNNRNELIFVLRERRTGTRLVTRSQVLADRVRTPTPFLPGGPPDGQLAIDFVDLTIRAISNSRGNYVTTPRTCPASGRWTNRATFNYDENEDETTDVSQTVASTSPCSGASGGGGGNDGAIEGTSGDDVLTGTPGDDVIRCGAGNDRVDAGAGDDTVLCGSDDDVVRGGPGDDRLFGQSGDDRLFGEEGDDRLVGDSGDDRLVGGPGSDRLSEGPGTDSSTQ